MGKFFFPILQKIVLRCLHGYTVIAKFILTALCYCAIIALLALLLSFPLWWLATEYSKTYSILFILLLGLAVLFSMVFQIFYRYKNRKRYVGILFLPLFFLPLIAFSSVLLIPLGLYCIFLCGYLFGGRDKK